MKEPRQVSIVMLLVIELLKLLSAYLQLHGELAGRPLRLRPKSIGQDLSNEVNTSNLGF